MRELYLLRHAKTKLAEPGQADRDRALAPRGRRASPEIGTYMATEGMIPDLVLCSTALRTRETLSLLLTGLRATPGILFEEELYLAEAQTLLDRLSDLPANSSRVLVVGHNPGIHELAHHFARHGASEAALALASGFPTGARARYELEGDWSEIDRLVRLVGYKTPRGDEA